MWTSSGKSTDVFCPDSGLYEPTTPKVGTNSTENCFCDRFDFSKFSSYNKALIAKVDQMISEVCIHFIVNNYLWIKWTKWYQRFRFILSSKIVWNLGEEFKSKCSRMFLGSWVWSLRRISRRSRRVGGLSREASLKGWDNRNNTIIR